MYVLFYHYLLNYNAQASIRVSHKDGALTKKYLHKNVICVCLSVDFFF